MASTRLFIPAGHTLPEMGELSDIAFRLAKKYNFDYAGVCQGIDFRLEFTQDRHEQLTYSDKVCTATFQHLRTGERQVHYKVKSRYLEGQMQVLYESGTSLGPLLANDLGKIEPASEIIASRALTDFSEAADFIDAHIKS